MGVPFDILNEASQKTRFWKKIFKLYKTSLTQNQCFHEQVTPVSNA